MIILQVPLWTATPEILSMIRRKMPTDKVIPRGWSGDSLVFLAVGNLPYCHIISACAAKPTVFEVKVFVKQDWIACQIKAIEFYPGRYIL